jgi:hypothetical protein
MQRIFCFSEKKKKERKKERKILFTFFGMSNRVVLNAILYNSSVEIALGSGIFSMALSTPFSLL